MRVILEKSVSGLSYVLKTSAGGIPFDRLYEKPEELPRLAWAYGAEYAQTHANFGHPNEGQCRNFLDSKLGQEVDVPDNFFLTS